jgi:Fis family transcriptional regulator
MTTAIKDDDLVPASLQLRVHQADRADPLGKCVQEAMETYLQNMDGHTVTDLYRLVIDEVERPLFETVVRHAEGNLTQAARMLGLTRSTLRKRLADHGIARGR